MPSIRAVSKQRRLRWQGYVYRWKDGRIPKDMLYGEVARARRPLGRLKLYFKDTSESDIKAFNIDHDKWETITADDRSERQIGCG